MIRCVWIIAGLLLLATAPSYAVPSISVSPSSVEIGTTVTATWTGISSPVATDWIGTYAPAAANTAYQSNWVYVSCTQTATSAAGSGSCSIATSSLAAGTYELRLLIADGFTSVATSSTFTVTSTTPSATRFITNNGLTSGSCTTSGTACRANYALSTFAAADETFQLACGTYQGANNMLQIGTLIPGTSGTSGHPITVQAESDGCVFLDGQFTTFPLYLEDNSYWVLQGFDAGNSGAVPNDTVATLHDSTHNTIRQACFSNSINSNPGANAPVAKVFGNSTNNLFEDVCIFGVGRLTIQEQDPGAGNNTYRRIWTRYEGWNTDGANAGSPVWEFGYHTNNSSTLENIISVFSPSTQTPSASCLTGTCYGAFLQPFANEGPGTGYIIKGWIAYGQDNPSIAINYWFHHGSETPAPTNAFTDIFIDARAAPATATPIHIRGGSLSRVTVIRGSSTPNSVTTGASVSNLNEGTSLSSLPNFYTGDSPGTGARNCFEYTDGVLGTTSTQRLWPWRMDDRIKAALARANTAGTGGTALSGTAGSGYAAATVTSEIVSRYGDIPSACLREAVFTPSFPVASDFPSVSVRDDFDRADSGTLGAGWTELTSDVFSIASNVAAAPASGFARAIYTDTKLQVDHEVYATWPTVQSCCGYMTILSFAGTTNLSANSQYRYEVNRQSSGNTMVKVVKIDSGGSSTTIIPEVDLGTDIADTNSFGVRVSGTTLSIYWKWTDGIWYRVGSVTDSTLATLPSSGVYGGMAGVVRSTINNFGAGPFVDQPVQEPPSPPASVGAGRFGTTFPGVR